MMLADIARRGRAALAKWGPEAQAFMICEEAGELGVATAQFMRGRVKKQDLLDEAADGVIVSVQAAVLAGCDSADLAAAIWRKLKRLDDRLAGAEGHFGAIARVGGNR